jgi:polysaccharide biosynthesis transport protein
VIHPTTPGGPPTEPTDTVVTIRGLWRNGRKHWFTVLATLAAVTLIVTFYTVSQKKIYLATSTLQFDPNPPKPLGKNVDAVVEMGSGSFLSNREYFETQYKVIQSMRVATDVVRELGLNRDAAFLANAAAGDTPPAKEVDLEEAADLLIERLKVEPVKESRLAAVSLEDADPERAQRILSKIVDTYMEENLDDALASTSSAVEWLTGQLEKLNKDLESSEMALHEYKMKQNILSVAFDDQSNMLREELRQINEALTGVRTKRENIAARREELAQVPSDDPGSLPATELLQSPLLQILRQRFEEAMNERKALLGSGKGEKHPDVVAATARATATREALLSEVRNIQGALARDLSSIKREERGLSGLYDGTKKQAFELNLMAIEYDRLLRTKTNTEKLYTTILERTKETELSRMLRVNNIRIVDRPFARRKKPVRPRVLVNIGSGVLVGLLLGLAAATMRTLLDRTVKTPADMEALGVTFLGLLPIIDRDSGSSPGGGKRRRSGKGAPAIDRELVVHRQPMSGFAEAARSIRTNIMFTAPDHPYRTLLVTSAGPAEGKTTVACCLAIAMAQAGQRVALVDCDLRRPRIHRIFKKGSAVGVTTALMQQSPEAEDEVFLPTEIDNLTIVPAGPLPPNPAELLHSEGFKRLLASIAGRFDRVVIDSPPIVPVTDAAVLSTLTDGTVLVVRAFSTNKEVVTQAVRALTDVGAKTAGVVLNAVNLEKSEYRYYRYYRRGGYYSSDLQAPAAPSGRQPEEAAPPH